MQLQKQASCGYKVCCHNKKDLSPEKCTLLFVVFAFLAFILDLIHCNKNLYIFIRR